MTASDGKPLRIMFFGGGWPTNIGNAFIDMGAMAVLRKAFPDANIAFGSGLPRWYFRECIETIRGRRRSTMGRLRHKKTAVFGESVSWDNSLVPTAFAECDLAVYAGNALTEEFVRQSGPAMQALADRGVPIMLLGVGAAEYTQAEHKTYVDFLKRLNPIAFVSRDEVSYELFSGAVGCARQGIDCGFFLPEAYQPFRMSIDEFAVLAFDDIPEPDIQIAGADILRAHHVIWNIAPERWLLEPRTMISDIPQDYLSLYANAREVHSDRVHACVASLAYGNSAHLYNSTKRSTLFDAVGASGIHDGLVKLDQSAVSQKKTEMVAFVREVVDNALAATAGSR